MRSRNIARIAIGTLCLLLIPLLGNRFIDGWSWSPGDFLFAGVMIFGTGLAYVLVAGKGKTAAYRAAVGVAVAAAFLLIWVNAAVGIIGDDNPANILYFGVLAVGITGATLARFQPRGMAITMFAMALAQMLVPVIALIFGRSDFAPGVAGVFGLNGFFAVLFVVSALLFRQQPGRQATPTLHS